MNKPATAWRALPRFEPTIKKPGDCIMTSRGVVHEPARKDKA